MSCFREILFFILCCEEDDCVDRSYTNTSHRNSIRTSESYETFLPRSFTTSSSTCRSDSISNSPDYYRPRYTNPSINSAREAPNPLFNTSPFSANTFTYMERNHERPQSSMSSASSQTTYSPRSSSMPPVSSSSSSSRSPSLQPPLVSSKPPSSVPAKSLDPPVKKTSSSSTLSGLPTSSSNSLPSFKPTLRPAPSRSVNQQTRTNYVSVENGSSPIYRIPRGIEDAIKNDIVPQVLEKPLSPSTYMDYFSALLYAEDYYIEKWSNFLLKKVTLKFEEATVHKSGKKEDKIFVAFEVDRVPERRPFLLSRDFVFAKPVGTKVQPFQGVINRVVKSTKVLVEFGDDFHSRHWANKEYDISFSFNRVCLKRAHQAVAAASDPSFHSFLFPDLASSKRVSISEPVCYTNYRLNLDQKLALQQILNFKGSPPYLIEGPLCVTHHKELSETGTLVRQATVELYRRSPETRILICAPINSTLDVLLRSLKKDIPKSEMFRANAAFREIDCVPDDIKSSCLYDEECFFCPSLQELKKYKVILATFVSAFRLRNEGIIARHFSHIFLVDASSAPEPEVMIALANLAIESTSVIVMGEHGNGPGWVRSDIARRNGLRVSYFERLCKKHPYASSDPNFISKVKREGGR